MKTATCVLSSLDISLSREQSLKISIYLLSQSTNFLNKEMACLVKLIKELKLYAIVTVLDVGVKIISYLEQLLIFSIKVNRIAIFTSSPGCWIISQVTKHEICLKLFVKHISHFEKVTSAEIICWQKLQKIPTFETPLLENHKVCKKTRIRFAYQAI